MKEDLDMLYSLGIVVRDIRYGNYLRGKLVDFSRAWTMYHPSLDLTRPGRAHALRKQEILDLEQMIYDFWAQKPVSCLRISNSLEGFSTVTARIFMPAVRILLNMTGGPGKRKASSLRNYSFLKIRNELRSRSQSNAIPFHGNASVLNISEDEIRCIKPWAMLCMRIDPKATAI